MEKKKCRTGSQHSRELQRISLERHICESPDTDTTERSRPSPTTVIASLSHCVVSFDTQSKNPLPLLNSVEKMLGFFCNLLKAAAEEKVGIINTMKHTERDDRFFCFLFFK